MIGQGRRNGNKTCTANDGGVAKLVGMGAGGGTPPAPARGYGGAL